MDLILSLNAVFVNQIERDARTNVRKKEGGNINHSGCAYWPELIA